jgi:hypothetical protein
MHFVHLSCQQHCDCHLSLVGMPLEILLHLEEPLLQQGDLVHPEYSRELFLLHESLAALAPTITFDSAKHEV